MRSLHIGIKRIRKFNTVLLASVILVLAILCAFRIHVVVVVV